MTDDENQTCTATLSLVFDDGGSNAPTTPALWQAPDVLVAATGEVVYFGNGAVDPVGEALSYAWDFGDTLTSSCPHPPILIVWPASIR
ncbi:MAG: PKD domain-containing protein [Chloroflexi bacterium]|nr:PKD domain-containing protein [Chloroflexota bacterium]